MTDVSSTGASGNTGEVRFAVGECWLGWVLAAQGARGLCAVALGSEPDVLVHELLGRFPGAQPAGDGFDAAFAKVASLVEAPGTEHGLTLDMEGTAFQRRVWDALLRQVPPGTTVSYLGLARIIGHPGSARAVAQACGANALAVVVPCHRVVHGSGWLSGYRWGVGRKQALLAREATLAARAAA